MAGRLDEADVSYADRQLLNLCRKITFEANRTTPEDIQALRDAGWSDPQIAEAVQVASLFAMFNRVADAFGLADPGYIDMGKSASPIKPATDFE